MSRPLARILWATGCLLLAGCASYAGIAPEARSLDVAALTGGAAATPYAGWPSEEWWQELGDPVLTGLIEQALSDSPNLQAAVAKLNRARAIADQAASTRWPQVDATSSNSRERFSEHGLIPPPYAGTTQNVNEIQIGGHWEMDFFGKNRESLQAALGELRATAAEHQATRMLLASSVARSYVNLARLLAQRELTEQRSRQRSELATLVERRFKAGLDTRVEVEAAQGVLSENARDVGSLDEQIGVVRHALAALVGQGPDAVNAIAPALPAVAPLALPPSLPADLLGHRADVVAARWRVESALHGLESTKALLYPNINLRAFAGLSAIGFDNWLDAGSRHPGIGLAISLPLFDAGRLRSVYRSSAASVDSSVAIYNSTLLDALRDVADQLSTLQALETQLARQQAALASAERGYGLALRRYQADISDRLTVLNVETNVIAQRRIAVDLRARWIDGRIQLVRALGGGFGTTAATALTLATNPETNPDAVSN
jgi:NodT family efflux transporter outer membrane factor (OMF) lipoprotein